MYSPQVLEHFQNPRNIGELPDASASARVENPACGDLIDLHLKVKDGRIEAVRYRVRGCVTSIACGSKLTELISGKTLEEARALRREDIVGSLGGLTPETMHGSHLAFDALQLALAKLR